MAYLTAAAEREPLCRRSLRAWVRLIGSAIPRPMTWTGLMDRSRSSGNFGGLLASVWCGSFTVLSPLSCLSGA